MEQNIDLRSNVEKNSFPPELLSANIEERKNYFKNYIVLHKYLEEAINKTVGIITTQISERLVFVCGPSGVGKKELIKAVIEKIVEQQRTTIVENPGCIPVAYVEAIAPEQGSFNFRNLWRSVLANLSEPMLDQKISYREIKGCDAFGQDVNLFKIQKTDYQDILQNTLKYRDVKVLIINEAHHMLRVASGKKANWSVDLLKSLTNCSRTPIVLVGTYELLNCLVGLDSGITDQINQRTKIVNFPRYRSNIVSEVNIFAKTAKLFLRNMPFEQSPEVLVDEDWKYFYTYSLGCIGSLKNWLMDAYSLAVASQAKTLTKDLLEETKISGKRCESMFDKIANGESKMAEIQSDGDIDKKIIFIKSKGDLQGDSQKSYSKNETKPYERKLKRDRVGTE